MIQDWKMVNIQKFEPFLKDHKIMTIKQRIIRSKLAKTQQQLIKDKKKHTHTLTSNI